MSKSRATPESELRTGLIHSVRLNPDPRAPLLVLVHGRAGTHELMWTFASKLTEFTVIAPQAPLPDERGGFSWWSVTAGNPPSEFEVDASAAALRSFIENARTAYELTPRSVIAFGFSQGAAILSVLMQREPDLFEGVALLAGFVLEQEPAIPGARASVFIGHGSDDTIAPPALAERGAAFLRGHGHAVEMHVEPVAHKVGAQTMRKLVEWANGFAEEIYTVVG